MVIGIGLAVFLLGAGSLKLLRAHLHDGVDDVVEPPSRGAVTRPPPDPLREKLSDGMAKDAAGDLWGALQAFDAGIKEFQDAAGASSRPESRAGFDVYSSMLAASDRIVAVIETPEYDAAVPVRDLLDPRKRRLWGVSAGIEMKFVDGAVELTGVEVPGRKVAGVASVLSKAVWHDIVLDLELKLVSGAAELYVRYWPGKPTFLLQLDAYTGYDPGKTYQMRLRVSGSTVELLQPDQNPQTDTVRPVVFRTGGFGFGLRPGSKVIISSCKLKVLR